MQLHECCEQPDSPLSLLLLLLPTSTVCLQHPGIMYGTWAAWDGTPLPNKPLFYHSASQQAADMVADLTADTRAVIVAMSKQMGLAEAVDLPGEGEGTRHRLYQQNDCRGIILARLCAAGLLITESLNLQTV
jgi:hypothetical protein